MFRRLQCQGCGRRYAHGRLYPQCPAAPPTGTVGSFFKHEEYQVCIFLPFDLLPHFRRCFCNTSDDPFDDRPLHSSLSAHLQAFFAAFLRAISIVSSILSEYFRHGSKRVTYREFWTIRN